jgi:molecular chaperone GrpE
MDDKTTKSKEEKEPKETEAAETSNDEMAKLRQDLESLRKEKDEVFDRLQRVYADYANFQKRAPKNIADSVAYEKERFIRSFLPVLDNFDRTLREARTAQNVEAVIKGVQIIRDQMLAILKAHGVEPIETVNEKFDPERHEALLRRSEPDKEDDIVLEEFQKGYTLSGRVIRPSRVAINKVQAQPQVPPAEEQASPQGTEAPEAAPERE